MVFMEVAKNVEETNNNQWLLDQLAQLAIEIVFEREE